MKSDLKRLMKISFHAEIEMNKILKDPRYKVNVRSLLGVKSQEDWIYNLNIGNVMLLTSL